MENKKITEVIINVSAKDFVIKCSEDFAKIFEADIDLISKGTKKIELKDMIQSFVAKSYENYEIRKQIDELIKALNTEPIFKVSKR
ncbi:hypothetical protein [Campylobacter troglodytis]|uniref:hypothetical protein n=1 Tax=Campylobacter troglodytis TaxID=654363 RepID=UPI001157A791|nr:hypothetical protein [Campylobacter troglodytis]TQR61335.1 hypothetical protein DMC01_01825 [Campylobacter troglodytis]